MEDRTPFEKSYTELDDSEKLLWTKATEILNHGDRLYGNSPDDASPVWWVVGMALASLRDGRQEGKVAAVYLEIGLDKDGFFVSPLKFDDEKKDGEE